MVGNRALCYIGTIMNWSSRVLWMGGAFALLAHGDFAAGNLAPAFSDPPRIAMEAGAAQVFDNRKFFFMNVQYRAAYRYRGFTPWILIGGTYWDKYAAVGILADIPLRGRWNLTPAFGGGFYDEGRRGIDLGHPVEFRSSLELSWQFRNRVRIGLNMAHLSNSRLGRHNPGTETFCLVLSVPLGGRSD